VHRSAGLLIGCCVFVVVASWGVDEAALLSAMDQSTDIWLNKLSSGEPLSLLEQDRIRESMRWMARGQIGMSVAMLLGFGALVRAAVMRIRRGVEAPGVAGPLSEFSPWDGLVWPFIIGLFAWIVDDGPFRLVGWNLVMFTGLVYWVRGLAVTDHALLKRSVSSWSRFAGYSVVFLTLPPKFLLLPAAGLGLFDTWFDFRHLSPESREMEALTDGGGDTS